MKKILTIFRNLKMDPVLLGLVLLAMAFDLVILYSSSGNSYIAPLKQLARFAIGFSAMLAVAQIPPRIIGNKSYYLYALGIILLIYVFFMGHIGKGAQRWLSLGFITFEPSEIMKIALPLVIAKVLNNASLPINAANVVKAFFIILLPVAITIIQPDLGTAILLTISGSCVIFLAGLRWKIIFTLLAILITSVPISWHFLHSYQKQRILTFLDPESMPLTNGYHIIQSKIAIGSGGIWGKGWLSGSQSHMNFLPENSTDFIFAHICEEFGLIGAILVIALILAITLRGYHIAINAQDTFSRLAAASISTNFFCYAFINIGMSVGILPVVGVPLPLISYGGSFLVTVLSAIGILMSIHSNKKLINS
jgi:rod shape determining protein RodA